MEFNSVRPKVKTTPDVINKMLKLYFEEDLTLETVGRRFGLSYGTVYKYILEAVKDNKDLYNKMKKNKYRQRG